MPPTQLASSAQGRPTIIVGAGLAGLSYASHAAHESCVILEQHASPGGLARTRQKDGFHFDYTGHWLHLKDPTIKVWVHNLMQGDAELVKIQRRASVYTHHRHIPYPFQANLHGLPAKVRDYCLQTYLQAQANRQEQQHPPCNLESYMRYHLGDGITETFMLPYNEKLWCHPASSLDPRWCKRFVPLPSSDEVLRGANATTPPTTSSALGYNSSFYYPRQGGIGTLALRIAAHLKHPLHLRTQVRQVQWRSRTVSSNRGHLPYHRLVSTMPLPSLVRALHPTPTSLKHAAEQLRAVNVSLWDIALSRPTPSHQPHWTYFPDPNLPFYRVGCPTAVVPTLAPKGHTTLQVEVSHTSAQPPADTSEHIMRGLQQVGLVEPNETPTIFEQSTIKGAYVLMDRAYDEARHRILDWLEAQNIHPIGRYGSWTYDSMEGALIQGKNLALAHNGDGSGNGKTSS